MCEPATILAVTTLVISAASATATVVGQQQQAKSTNRYQTQMVEQANEIALADFKNRTSAEQTQLTQLDEQANQKKLQNNIEAAKAIGTARAATGETNSSGTAIDSLYADFERSNALFKDSVDTNTKNARSQYQANTTGLQTQGLQYLSNFNYAPVRGGDYVGAALQIGAGGLTAYDRYQMNKKP